MPADIYRPAAIEQLTILAKQNEIPVFASQAGESVAQIVEKAKAWAKQEMVEVVIVDTAGRLQIDEPLMAELRNLKSSWPPNEILLVADAMLGQQSVQVAEGFNSQLGLTGLILTKVDGDARGGAALSIRKTTACRSNFLAWAKKSPISKCFIPIV